MKTLELSKPHALIMVGTPGSGKSAFAGKFACDFNAPIIDFETILDLANDNKTHAKHIMNFMLEQLLKTKQTIVFDGYGNDLNERLELSTILQKNGYKTFVVWVQTDPMTMKIRLMKKYEQSGPEKEVDRVTDALINDFQSPRESEVSVVISGRHTYSSQAQTVLRKLSKRPSTNTKKAPAEKRKTISVSEALANLEKEDDTSEASRQASQVHAPRQSPPIAAGRREIIDRRKMN